MDNWLSFLRPADEWLINYSIVGRHIPSSSVITFSIGHSVELYLKAANTKITGDIKRAISFGHKIKAIWDDCKNHDSSFMPSYELRDSVFNYPQLFTGKDLENFLSKDDLNNFYKHSTLYLIAKHLPDLKYLGAPLKSFKGAYALAYIHPDPYWIRFFKEMRGYLSYPQADKIDCIRRYIHDKSSPQHSVQYLKELYE